VAGRNENLKPWKPGQSGNPGGRPKNDVASEIAKAVFSQNPEMIYQAFLKALKKGNVYAFKVLADRAYGKAKETREVMNRYEDLSDADLQREIDSLLSHLGLASVTKPNAPL
jgi:Family of unknown function (DUF5681)